MPEERIETIHEGKFLRMLRSGRWEFVSRTKGSGVVVILPVTADRKVILIGEFRVAPGKMVIGLPAGLAGDDDGGSGEELLTAAQRELAEETGYTSSRWSRLAEGPSSPGMTDEMVTFFLAEDAVAAAKIATEEEISVWAVALEELSGWLEKKRGEGCLIEYKIFAALWLWEQRGRKF